MPIAFIGQGISLMVGPTVIETKSENMSLEGWHSYLNGPDY